jgi:uncharacterized protein (DUF2236 family)
MSGMAATVHPPQSVTWQVHIDRSMWVGGVRGLMLQALHPIAMRGVWQNSSFQKDPIGRLQRTADFVSVVTWGDAEEADRIGRKVRAMHRSLRVTDPDTGRVHRVDEPELLLWVHCAEVYSYLEIARRAGLRLTDRQADRYLTEQRRSAAYVGLHEEDVPGSVAEMEDYFTAMLPRLKATPEARSAVRFLLWPKLPRDMRHLRPGKPLYLPFGVLCYYSLPTWARRMYGILPEIPQALVTAGLRSFRPAANSLPELLHERLFNGGTRDMLEGARRRLEAEGYDLALGLRGLRNPRRWPTATCEANVSAS